MLTTTTKLPKKLVPSVKVDRDHVLGPDEAEITLVEYGSYTSRNCHIVHDVIKALRSRFGDQMRYVFVTYPFPIA